MPQLNPTVRQDAEGNLVFCNVPDNMIMKGNVFKLPVYYPMELNGELEPSYSSLKASSSSVKVADGALYIEVNKTKGESDFYGTSDYVLASNHVEVSYDDPEDGNRKLVMKPEELSKAYQDYCALVDKDRLVEVDAIDESHKLAKVDIVYPDVLAGRDSSMTLFFPYDGFESKDGTLKVWPAFDNDDFMTVKQVDMTFKNSMSRFRPYSRADFMSVISLSDDIMDARLKEEQDRLKSDEINAALSVSKKTLDDAYAFAEVGARVSENGTKLSRISKEIVAIRDERRKLPRRSGIKIEKARYDEESIVQSENKGVDKTTSGGFGF